MDEDVLVHELVNSLAFEVEAIATENMVKFTSANGTPLNVKVRLRNKDEPRLVQRGLISVPKLGKHITTPARIISSDQTILSFNVLMETELERQPTPKNRKHGFNFLKLGCLGTSADEDEGPYLPDTSNKKDLRSKTSSKSDSAIINENGAAPAVKLNLGTSNVVARNQGGLFGKCKPGGCLDPPFSEDKYSYGLPKTQPHIKLKKTLNLAEDTKANRNISISSKEPGKAPNTASEQPKNLEISKKDEVESKPLLNIFARTNSLQNSQTSNHSNSIITYPPELSSSEMISNDQNARKRSRSKTFSDGSPKQSYEYPESYFIPPKDIRQKEEERRYSRELSNDQIRFNDRNRDETSQNNGNQRMSLINNTFDPDINTTKYSGMKSIPQTGKGLKDKDKSNKEVIEQTLTYLTLENKDKPQKLNATQQKNSITLLEIPVVAQLNKKSPSLILTGSKKIDDNDKISKSPIENSQEYEEPQNKLRSNIQEPSVTDHITLDLEANLQDTLKNEKFRKVKSELPDNMGLAKDITNKNLSRDVENQGNIGSMQEQASDIYEIKPKFVEIKNLRPSAIFKNGVKEDKLNQDEPSSENSDLHIPFEEKRLMMPFAKPINTEINQTFGQENGPAESQYKSKKAKEHTKLSLRTVETKLLQSSLPNLLDNHDLNNTAIPDVTITKDEQPNANKEPENYPIKNSDKVEIRSSSQISPVEKKPQLQTTDSPVYKEEKKYCKNFNPLTSGTNIETRKDTEGFETPLKKTTNYQSDDNSSIKGKLDAKEVQELPKSSTVIETTQKKELDGLDIVDIQDKDPKENSVIAEPENKFTKHSAMFETPNKQMGDIQNHDIDNHETPHKRTLNTQDRKGGKNGVYLNKNKVIDTKPTEISLQGPGNQTNERIENTYGIQDDYLNYDDDRDQIIVKTTSDATVIPFKTPNATGNKYANNTQNNLTEDGLSRINKTNPIQTDTSEQNLDDYTSKVGPIDTTIIPSKSTSVKGQEPLVDNKDTKNKNLEEDDLSSLNKAKPFITDTKKQNLAPAKIQPMDATILPAESTNFQDILVNQEPVLVSNDIKTMTVHEPKPLSTDSNKQDLDMYTPKARSMDATAKSYKSTNIKEVIQGPLMDSNDPKNNKVNEDDLSSFNKTKLFQTDTKEQDLATSTLQPMNASIIPAKSTPVKGIIQEPELDSKDTKNFIENKDGLSSVNETKQFQTDTKDQDLATSALQPMNASIIPAKTTPVEGIIQEPVLDNKDAKNIIENKDGLSSFNEAKPLQTDTKEQDLNNPILELQLLNNTMLPDKVINIKKAIQEPLEDSKDTEHINVNEDGLPSFDEAKQFQRDTEGENLDNQISQTRPNKNVKKLNMNQIPRNLIPGVSSENNEHATSSTHSIDSYHDNDGKEQESDKDYEGQKITSKTKIDSEHVSHAQTLNRFEDLDKLNRSLIHPESAIDFSQKPKQNNELLTFDETNSVITNQLSKTDSANQNDPKDTDLKKIKGLKHKNINSSGSNENEIYQEPISLSKNQENITLPLDKPLFTENDDFNGQKSIKGFDASEENLFSKHINLDLDKERTTTDKKIANDDSQNELAIASGQDSGRMFADKNEPFDSAPNFEDDVLSYRSKISKTGNRISDNYKNQSLDTSCQIAVNTHTLIIVNEAQYADISSVDIEPQVKKYDDTSEKALVSSQSATGVSGPIGKKALPLGEIVDKVDEIMNVKNKSDQKNHENFQETIDFEIIEGFNKEIDYTSQGVTKHYGIYDPIAKAPTSTNYTNEYRYSGIGSGITDGFNAVNDITPQDITKRSGKYDPLSKVSTSKNDTNDNGLPKAKITLNNNIYADDLTKRIESNTVSQKVEPTSRNKFRNEPSRTSVERDKSAALLLNMSFQSYVNENGETIVRTFHPLEEPQRYADDKIVVVNSFIRPGNEIRIPVGPDHDLALNLFSRKNNALDDFNIRNNYTTNASLSEHVKLAARQRDDVLDKSLALIYERELIPLHNIMKNLTEEINSLSGQQEHKDKLLSAKRSKSLRLIPANTRCGCKRN